MTRTAALRAEILRPSHLFFAVRAAEAYRWLICFHVAAAFVASLLVVYFDRVGQISQPTALLTYAAFTGAVMIASILMATFIGMHIWLQHGREYMDHFSRIHRECHKKRIAAPRYMLTVLLAFAAFFAVTGGLVIGRGLAVKHGFVPALLPIDVYWLAAFGVLMAALSVSAQPAAMAVYTQLYKRQKRRRRRAS